MPTTLTDSRPLGPAEARLLLAPNVAGPRVLEAATRGLLASGAVRVRAETERRWWGEQKALWLEVREGVGDLPPHLSGLRDALAAAPPERLAPTELLAHLQKTYGVGFTRFDDAVRADLAARGLLLRVERRALGLFRTHRWERTPDGDAAALVLEGRLDDARTIPELLGHDPARAVAVAAGLGGLLLAADELVPHYGALADALREHRRDSTAVSAVGDAGMVADAAPVGDAAFDGLSDALGALGDSLDGLVDGLADALDAAFSIDAFGGAFDGGGGVDGDGGGGDGGGGD